MASRSTGRQVSSRSSRQPAHLSPQAVRCLELIRFWGAARRKDLLQQGISPHTIQALRAKGLLQDIALGVYAASDQASDGRARSTPPGRASQKSPSENSPVRWALQAGAQLTCVSAVRAHGFKGADVFRTQAQQEAEPLHLTRVRRPIPVPYVCSHHGEAAPEDRPGLARLREAVVHLLRCQPEMVGRVVLDEVIKSGQLASQALLEDLPGARNAQLRGMVLEAERSADSPLETVLRHTLRRRGWRVEPQVYILEVGQVDFLVNGRVVVEVDGYSFHSAPDRFRKDRERDLALEAHGYRVVRVAALTLLWHPERVVAQIEEVLRHACRDDRRR